MAGGGRIYHDIVTVDGIEIYNVTSSPVGTLEARRGSVAVRSDAGQVSIWQNTDGATGWVAVSASAGGVWEVATSGKTYTSIEAALTAAGAVATAATPQTVVVWPGDYTESNPVTVPDHVNLFCPARHHGTTLVCSNANAHGLVCGDFSDVVGLHVQDASGAGFAGFHFPAGLTTSELHDVTTSDCDIGVLCDSAGSIRVREMAAFGTLTTVLQANAGSLLHVTDLIITGGTPTTYGLATGAAAVLELVSADLSAPTATTGLWATGGGIIRASGITIEDATTSLRVDASSEITATGVAVNGTTTFDLQVAATGTFRASGCQLRNDRLSLASGAILQASYYSDAPGDQGQIVLGEMHVGRPGQGAEVALGEGDSNTRGMVVKTDDGSGTSFITHTDDATAGTAFSAFQSTAVGEVFLIGNTDRAFPGFKDSVTTALVIGGATLVFELSNGAGGWNALPLLTTDSSSTTGNPQAHAQELWERVQSSQIRWDTNHPSFTAWAMDTIDGVNAFWMRVRIAVAVLATVPVLESSSGPSLKCHTNRWECNAGGDTEYFGVGIPERTIPLPPVRALTGGGAPGSINIAVSANITYTGDRNRYGTGDGVAYNVPIPEGLDTSRGLTFVTVWKPSNSNTGDVVLRLIVVEAETGDVVAGALAETNVDVTQAASGVTDALQVATEHTFRVPNLRPGDALFLAHTRLAAGDTFTGNVEILDRSLRGYFWKG